MGDPTNEFTIDYDMTGAGVIPDFPLLPLLSLFIVAILLTAIIYRRIIKPER